MENKVPVEFEDRTYRLEEMVEAIEQSIANIEKVTREQRKLIGVINHSKYRDDFKEFVESSKNQLANLIDQRNSLNEEVALLNAVIEMCKNNDECKKVVTVLLTALRVFEPTPKD